MHKSRFLILFFLLILGAHYPFHAQSIDETQTLSTEDGDRLFHLHLPPQAEDSAVPLVIALHPIASSGNAMRALTGLNQAADEYGFAVAYPQALSFYWDDGRAAAGMLADDGEIDDIGFIEAMIDIIAQQANINTERVHLTGLGQGGTMAYRLSCTIPERFASVAIIGALMWSYQPDDCPANETPINMLMVHGSADTVYFREGRSYQPGEAAEDAVAQLGLDETLDFWIERNRCDTQPTALSRTPLSIYTCEDDTTLNFYSVITGDNGWYRDSESLRLNQVGIDMTAIVSRYFMDDETPLDVMSQTPLPATELPRSYLMYVPTNYTFDEPMPVVFVLHGRPGSSWGIALITDMNSIAEENGFIAVYPDGAFLPSEQGRSWNYVRDVPLFMAADSNVITQRDDVQFLVDLVHDIAELAPVDTDRAYVTGFSNGGFMTQRLACDAAGAFAAFAAVGSTLSWGMPEICEGKPSVPLMMIHGTQDVSVPWTGTTGTVAGQQMYITAPIPNTMVFWAQHNNCPDEAPLQEDLPQSGDSPETSVTTITYQNCDEPLTFIGITNGGHNWPGVPGRIGAQIAGNVNMDIHAGQVVWDFMSQFTLDEERIEAAEAVATPSAPIVIDETAASEPPEVSNARQVVETLQRGGFVIYFRHGEENPDYDDETCEAPGALTPTGDNQAGLLYTVLERLSLQIGTIYSAGTCAAQQTISRAFSEEIANGAIVYDSTEALNTALITMPESGLITLIVGDGTLLEEQTARTLGPADTLIIRPDGATAEVLTTATIYDWLNLSDLINESGSDEETEPVDTEDTE